MVTDCEAESITRLPRYERAGSSAPRSARPACAGLEASKPMGGVAPAVDFLRPAADERPRRALFVLPIQTGHPFSGEFSASRRNQNTASALVLPGSERAFDHGQAAVLPHRSGAGLDFLASTPILAGLAPEDLVLVADQILRSRIDASNDAFQQRTYGARVGFLGETRPGTSNGASKGRWPRRPTHQTARPGAARTEPRASQSPRPSLRSSGQAATTGSGPARYPRARSIPLVAV